MEKGQGALDIDHDLEFQRRDWFAQRLGWAAIALIVLAGLIGVFGSGPLSSTRVAAADLEVEYERVARHGAEDRVVVRVLPAAVDRSAASLWVSRALLDEAAAVRVTPEPEKVEVAGDRVRYRFPVTDPGTPVVITFVLERGGYGLRRGAIGLESGSQAQLRQLVLP